MFTVTKCLPNDKNNNLHLSNYQSNKEYSMFISINANEEKLNDEIFYYYPNQTVEIEKFKIHPEKPQFFQDFYRKNISNYEKICNSVNMIISVNSQITKYNTSIGNFVKITDGNKEKKCILTCFSLIKRLELEIDDDLSKIEIYMISNIKNLYQFFKKLDFLINLNSPKDKLYFFERIKQEYGLIGLEKEIQSLKKRSELLRCLELTEYDYLFRDPISDNIIVPGIDILLLQIESKNNDYHQDSFSSDENFIEIDLMSIENEINVKLHHTDDFLTYITHHIPRQKIENILGRKKKLKIQKNGEEISKPICANNSSIGSNPINYEEFRCLEFSKSCCVYYDRSINFGKYEKNMESGLRVGHYSFNNNSAGTLLFNSEFKPVGVAFFGSFDYYPLTESKKLYNLFIPLDHIGVLYIFKSFLCMKDESIKIEDYLKGKNINLVKGSEQINKRKFKNDLVAKNHEILEEKEKY